MDFVTHLKGLARPILEAQLKHPFVKGVGQGNLEEEKFKYWVKQDYLFLIEYARLLALAVARAPTLPLMSKFSHLLYETLYTEMALHRSYASEWGISKEELLQEKKSPTTEAYTSFLLKTAALGDFAELMASLIPCMWSFSEIGQALLRAGKPEHRLYAKFIDIYGSEEFKELANWSLEVLAEITRGFPEEELKIVEETFLTSVRYEYLFWDMAYRMEKTLLTIS